MKWDAVIFENRMRALENDGTPYIFKVVYRKNVTFSMTVSNELDEHNRDAWKVSVFGVILLRIFPHSE